MKRLFAVILTLCLLLGTLPAAAAAGETTGTLEKRAGYDLATVRCELADGSCFYADVTETETGYTYRFDRSMEGGTVIPEYFSTTVWDGAVDISWYDKNKTEFYLDTPAKLAGLAALVNGRVDIDTPAYRIKGDQKELVSTREDNYLIIGAGGGDLRGTVYLGDAAHDFSEKSVYLTADMNMGGICNWTPIGGKYLMDVVNGEFLIEAFFNGTLDGQGHRITNLRCDRYSAKGYAYSWAIGFVGFLGELYEGETAPKTAPAVRNLSVDGSVYGRRSVGGIVGKSGNAPTGVYIENCANHASVKNTDAKGVGGIIGMAEGSGAIINCYNTGSVTTTYACPTGGIIGSNGGVDVFNCYSAGTIDSGGNQRGRGIGGHDKGGYTVSDCYYLLGSDDDPDSNGWYRGTALSVVISVTGMSRSEMQSQKLVDALNVNGRAYTAKSGSYPILAWETAHDTVPLTVTVTQPDGGTVAADCGATVPFGTVLHLSNTPATGWAFRSYSLNGKTLTGPYATVTESAEVSGSFAQLVAGTLHIQNDPDFTLRVVKDGTVMVDGIARRVTNYPVADGDPLYEGDVLTATASLAENAEPDDLNEVYTGRFCYYFTFLDDSGKETKTDTGKFMVTNQITSASLRLNATGYTTHKVWTQLAETDWYDEAKDGFTLTTARQLAGLALLVKQGNRFVGKTVRLGADISLLNDDKTFNRSVRWFDGIGSTQAPFSGTFDGNGFQIVEMTAETTGSGAALFLAADGAVLKNLRVSGTVRANGSAAGIVAQAKNTTILNCVNEATVFSGGNRAGGIAAQLDSACVVTACTNRGAVTGTDGLGGIAGVVLDRETVLCDCVNEAALTANGSSVGIGGIAGSIGGSLTRCANYGALRGRGWYMGGVAGTCMTENAAALHDCYNVGDITNEHTYSKAGTGGLIGYGNYYRAENCFNYGTVTAAAGTTGGTIGRDSLRSTSVRSNLYYRTNSCAYAGNGKAEMTNVAVRTAAEMASAAFLQELNRSGCFALVNGKYPEFAPLCPHEHTELKNAAAATCTEAGYTGDLYCRDCGKLLESGKPIPAAGHSYQNGVCTACGAKDPNYVEPEKPWVNPFKDVREHDWFYNGVKFANRNGLFNGTEVDLFSPENAMTRGMLVTVLWRLDGKTPARTANAFTDVPASQYYAEPVAWASENGIVNGIGGGKFDPEGNVTREQMAAILYRYANSCRLDTGKRGDFSAFPDAASVSDWATDALSWTLAEGIINGTGEAGGIFLNPEGNATRAQVAVIFMRYVENVINN